MGTDRRFTYKNVVLAILVFFLTGCFFCEKKACELHFYEATDAQEKTEQETIFGAETFAKIEMTGRMERGTGIWGFLMLQVVLLWMACAPDDAWMTAVIGKRRRILRALRTIVCYVHDSDGKKWTLDAFENI